MANPHVTHTLKRSRQILTELLRRHVLHLPPKIVNVKMRTNPNCDSSQRVCRTDLPLFSDCLFEDPGRTGIKGNLYVAWRVDLSFFFFLSFQWAGRLDVAALFSSKLLFDTLYAL